MNPRVTDTNGLFSFELPVGWHFFPDDEGGGAISPDSSAVLHFHSEPVEESEDLPNLSRMLAGFLTLHHKPVATDELLRMQVGGAQAFAWQYLSKEGKAVRVWVVGDEFCWVFLNFQASPQEAARLAGEVDAMVASLRLEDGVPPP